jgi:hypothetical protein
MHQYGQQQEIKNYAPRRLELAEIKMAWKYVSNRRPSIAICSSLFSRTEGAGSSF